MPKHMMLRTILRKAQGGKCCYCGVQMTRHPSGNMPKGGWPRTSETIEHLRRRADGGRATPDNVALACYECNTNRGGIDWFTYATYRSGELTA